MLDTEEAAINEGPTEPNLVLSDIKSLTQILTSVRADQVIFVHDFESFKT